MLFTRRAPPPSHPGSVVVLQTGLGSKTGLETLGLVWSQFGLWVSDQETLYSSSRNVAVPVI